MIIKKVLYIASIMFTLSGCSPVYEDKYVFVPPKDKDAKLCANECVVRRDACMQKCMDRGSVVDFGNKFISTFGGDGGSVDGKTTKECDATCSESHRICHANCGGLVRVDKVCTAFCNKAK